jgi:catechol 1,2-dioxygenase
MIIRNEREVTQAVLSELDGIQDERLKTILGAAVRHLHAFVREVGLTEREFQDACALVAELGRRTTASHNEVVLIAGALGLSTLVCLLNNDPKGTGDTTANLLGPFWRAQSPDVENGGSIVRSDTPGVPIFVDAWVRDEAGRPVAGAKVDVWNTSAEGLYENQDPLQADMNLRGTLTTDEHGHIRFRSVKPAGYPVPVDGPTGDLLRVQGRHNLRPAHMHFLIHKPGYKTQFSQVYASDDPNLETDSQFGVIASLVGRYVRHEAGTAPDPRVTGEWYSLAHTFVLVSGVSALPRPPITGQARGERPRIEILRRTSGAGSPEAA